MMYRKNIEKTPIYIYNMADILRLLKKYWKVIACLILIMIVICIFWNHLEPFIDTRRKLIFYYSPHCPHSNEMEQKWISFVKIHEDNEKVRFIKKNIHENETLKDNIQILPTVRAYEGSKILGELHGSQSFHALEAFYCSIFSMC